MCVSLHRAPDSSVLCFSLCRAVQACWMEMCVLCTLHPHSGQLAFPVRAGQCNCSWLLCVSWPCTRHAPHVEGRLGMNASGTLAALPLYSRAPWADRLENLYLIVPLILARGAGSLAPQQLGAHAGSALISCLSSLQKGVSLSLKRRRRCTSLNKAIFAPGWMHKCGLPSFTVCA